jgi:hypothetical protein
LAAGGKLKDKILHESKRRGIVLRLVGGMAFEVHCPKHKHLFDVFGRKFPDIDVVGRLKQVVEIQKLFLDLGFEENKNVMRLFGTQRRIFERPGSKLHIDVILDQLRFCHDIDLRKRLEIDYPTVSLADLFLSKMQIVQINEKDLFDIIILLLEHDVGEINKETIDVKYISQLCSGNWGLWKTVTSNLEKTKGMNERYLGDHPGDFKNVNSKIDMIKKHLEESKKSIRWKLRAKIGKRIKWYREVEEVKR